MAAGLLLIMRVLLSVNVLVVVAEGAVVAAGVEGVLVAA